MKKFLFLLALLLAAHTAGAWSGKTHRYITIRAARNVPWREMADFQPYAYVMGFPSACPDLWRISDREAEAPRHFFEPDRFPGIVIPEGLAALGEAEALALVGMDRPTLGTAPWAITELLAWTTEAMRTNDWHWAARCAAAMAHYVGDLHQPLHCTRNFNGADTGQNGVHGRFEMDLVGAFFTPRDITPARARYIKTPLADAIEWGRQSSVYAQEVLEADLVATHTAGGKVDTPEYYAAFWEETGHIVSNQINDCVTHLSSLFYTAWVNAGKPEIPPPPEELNTDSVWSGVSIDPEEEAMRAAKRAAEDPARRRQNIILLTTFITLAVVALAALLTRAILHERRKARERITK